MRTSHRVLWNERTSRCDIVLLAVVTFSGCLYSSTLPSSTVSGKVTLNGTPVTAGSVLFMTDEGEAAAADLKPDGTYVVHCRPARFKVAVMPPPAADPLVAPASAGASGPIKPLIPRRYHDVGSSGLSVDVKEGANTFDLALTR